MISFNLVQFVKMFIGIEVILLGRTMFVKAEPENAPTPKSSMLLISILSNVEPEKAYLPSSLTFFKSKASDSDN